MFAAEQESITIRYSLADAVQEDIYAGPCCVELRDHGALAVVVDDDDVALYSPSAGWVAEVTGAAE